MDTFAERLRILRTAKRVSQGEFAKVLGIARATLASWEIGRREPDYAMLQKLADYFGVSADYLLGLPDSVSSGRLDPVPSPSEDELLDEAVTRAFSILSRDYDRPIPKEAMRAARAALKGINDNYLGEKDTKEPGSGQAE